MDAGSSVTVFGLSTAVLWGAADFSGGLATRRAAPAFVVAIAHGFGLLLLIAAAFALRIPIASFSLYGLLSGVFCGAGLIALYSALSRGSMGMSAAVSGVVTAVIPVVFTWIRYGHASPRRLIGFALAAIAIWLVTYAPAGTAAAPQTRSLGLAALSGASFGTMLILMSFAAAQGVLPALIALRLASASVAVLSGLAFFLAGGKASATPAFPAGKILLLALLAGTLDTSGNLLYLFAALAGRLDVSAVLASLYPAGTMLLAWWLLKERATRSQVAGMVLALAAVVLISI